MIEFLYVWSSPLISQGNWQPFTDKFRFNCLENTFPSLSVIKSKRTDVDGLGRKHRFLLSIYLPIPTKGYFEVIFFFIHRLVVTRHLESTSED